MTICPDCGGLIPDTVYAPQIVLANGLDISRFAHLRPADCPLEDPENAVSTTSGRTDEEGRARAGSQLQVQIYVDRKSDEIGSAILNALSMDPKVHRIEWRSPLRSEKFAEYKDCAFLAAVGLTGSAEALSSFWPDSGPRWDALGLIHGPDPDPAILLVEGKSYPKEIYGSGCTATHPDSRALITRSLSEAKVHFGIDVAADWMGSLYQYGNRLAHVHFLRNHVGRAAYLVNLCFVGDSSTLATSLDQWSAELAGVKKRLGFGGRPIPHMADVFLPAHGRDVLDAQ